MMSLLQTFETQLKQRKTIKPGDQVFVACSGGPDSTALIYLLHSLSEKWDLKLGLIHINHGLRGNAANGDEKAVKVLAAHLKIPFHSVKGSVKARAKAKKYSIEEAAREVRYELFEQMAAKHRIVKIALAHNLNDQAETVMMRILEGTGMRGLMGIRERRTHGKLIYVRPLLAFKKEEILDYLKKHHFSFRTDVSNKNQRFKRNKIRAKLFPYLAKQYNPRVIEALARIPNIVSEESGYLAELEEKAFKATVTYTRKDRIYFCRKRFMNLAGPIQFRVLGRALAKIDPASGLNFEQWQALRGELSRQSYRRSLRRDIDISITPSKLMVYKK